MEITQTRARALIRGTGPWSAVNGLATFRQCRRGVLVTVEVQGLPWQEEGEPWLGVGIQSDPVGACSDPAPEAHDFRQTVTGELPPLLGCGGMAFASFLTGRFRVEQIIGQTFLICNAWRENAPESAGFRGETIALGNIVAGC